MHQSNLIQGTQTKTAGNSEQLDFQFYEGQGLNNILRFGVVGVFVRGGFCQQHMRIFQRSWYCLTAV